MDLNTQAGTSSSVYTPDRLIAGDADSIVAKGMTLISGQNLQRGAVIGKITASGKYTLSLSASADGSQVPDAILAQDCDASAGDTGAIAYVNGQFAGSALTLGAGITLAAATDALRLKGVTIVSIEAP